MTKKARFFDFDETFTKIHTFKYTIDPLTKKVIPLIKKANIWDIQKGNCTDEDIAENIKPYAAEAIRACLEADDYVAFVTNNCKTDVILRYLRVAGLTPEEIERITILNSTEAKGVNPEFKRDKIADAMQNKFKDADVYYYYDDDEDCHNVVRTLQAALPPRKTFIASLITTCASRARIILIEFDFH